jgi:outer membrane protein OmpA-like peptidoglycan-associated protein
MVRLRFLAPAAALAACWAAPVQATCAPLSVFFDWNSTQLSEESQAALERLAVTVAWKGPDLAHVLLTSHTDTSGTPRANRQMALRRARAVREVLLAYQVPPELIAIQAVGEAAPRVVTARNVREPRNRRVELLIQMSADAQARQLENGQPIC